MADRQRKASSRRDEFQKLAAEKSPGVVMEILLLLRDNKKWWLIPIIVALLLIGLLVALGGTSVAPFIYTLF